jgi:hypothetical protein
VPQNAKNRLGDGKQDIYPQSKINGKQTLIVAIMGHGMIVLFFPFPAYG